MEKGRKRLKSIVISEVTFLHDEGTTSEYEATDFVVEVNEYEDENGSAQGVFRSRAEAYAYASDVAKRPLRPFNFARLLDLR